MSIKDWFKTFKRERNNMLCQEAESKPEVTSAFLNACVLKDHILLKDTPPLEYFISDVFDLDLHKSGKHKKFIFRMNAARSPRVDQIVCCGAFIVQPIYVDIHFNSTNHSVGQVLPIISGLDMRDKGLTMREIARKCFPTLSLHNIMYSPVYRMSPNNISTHVFWMNLCHAKDEYLVSVELPGRFEEESVSIDTLINIDRFLQEICLFDIDH